MEEQMPTKPAKRKHASKSPKAARVREAKLMKGLLEGKSLKSIAISTGLSPKSAASQASHIINQPHVKESFVRILEQRGLTDDFLARKAQELMEAETPHFFSKDGIVCDERYTPAHETRRKTLELVSKFKGHLKETSSADVSIGLMQMVVNVINEPERKD